MNKDEKLKMLGQRLVVGFPGTALDKSIIEVIKKYKIGNIILFQRNIESRSQLRALTDSIKALVNKEVGIEPFIMIDQEGGMVTRLSEDFVNIPSAMAIRALGNPNNAWICGRITACELISAGVNFDLAPVLDINSNPNNPVIGTRSYGEDPQSVIDYSIKMIKGLDERGVISCAKHFPGHGDTAVDSHMGLPVVDKDLPELRKMELRPFKAAIDANIPSIMTTHILFPKLDTMPATMSSVILKDLLRKELGFKGLIVTDCLEMGAIAKHYGTIEAVKTALDSGADIACVSHHAELATEAIDRILEVGIDEVQLKASYDRILFIKKKYLNSKAVGNKATDNDIAEIDRLGQSSLTVCNIPQASEPNIGEKPVFIGCLPFVVTMASNPENESLSFSKQLSEALGGDSIVSSIDPTEDEIKKVVKKADKHSSIIFGTYNGHVKMGQIALGKALEKLGIPMIVVALRNPYDLAYFNRTTFTIAAYEYTNQSLKWLKNYFRKEAKAMGKPFFNLEVSHA